MEKRYLIAEEIVRTIDALCYRIKERFPRSGLLQTSEDLLALARETEATVRWIGRPNGLLRLLVAGFVIVMVVALVVGGLAATRVNVDGQLNPADLVQMINAGTSEMILIGAAVLFLVSIEVRTKRRRVIAAVNTLRSIAHVIDMHQLTKDPQVVQPGRTAKATPHSPKREMTPFELSRYLDYCAEMLSLVSKVAFLYVQHFHDGDSVRAVNELENLTNGLSRKIWQKIMLLKAEPEKPPAVAPANAPA